MNTDGWLKLHRRLLEHPVFTQLNPEALKVWIFCLLRANRAQTSWYDGRSQVSIPEGAFVFSLDGMARQCGISLQQLRTAISHLKNLSCITVKSTNKYSLLIIENWTRYQSVDDAINTHFNIAITNGQQTVNKRSTTEEEVRSKKREERKTIIAPNGAGVRGKRSYDVIGKALGQERTRWWLEFWSIFPCHEGKLPAMDAFERKIRTEEDWQACREGAKRYAALVASNPDLKLKYGQGWINDSRWDDENKIIPRLLASKAEEQAQMARELFEMNKPGGR